MLRASKNGLQASLRGVARQQSIIGCQMKTYSFGSRGSGNNQSSAKGYGLSSMTALFMAAGMAGVYH